MKSQDILLLKKLRGELTLEEESLFNEWINESKSNLLLYKRLVNLKKEGKDAYKISTLDVEQVWKNIRGQVRENRTDRYSFYKSKTPYYMAAASILILISIIFFLNENEEVTNGQPIIVNNQIKVGTDKAILTLESGEEIVLSNNTFALNDNASCNGKEIIYNKNIDKGISFDVLTVPRGGQFKLILADGTNVWLNSESQLKYPTFFFEGEDRIVELVYGEAYFSVSPSTEHKNAKFQVYHDEQMVEVLGTEFNIKAYKYETNILTTLVEGKVQVSVGDEKFKLDPGYQSCLNQETKNMNISTVDAYNETSWKEGVFSFENKPLKEIMVVLSRWYDMDVAFENKNLEQLLFNGKLKKSQSIVQILEAIKYTDVINNYEINNKNLTLK